MSKHIDLMEPIFFTPPNQPTNPVGGRKLFKGGGGGSGQRDVTEEEKRLWSAQADSLEKMNAVSMPNLVTGMNNLNVMANESMDGTLASHLRGMAGADASAAMGQGLTAATQKLDRYGATMNPNAMAATMARTGLDSAAIKSGAMNQANVAAEDTKWNRNAALTGLASGQGAQAISGMGSLSGQIAANRAGANAMDAQAQQSQGNAMAGLITGGKMMGLYKDGGRVRKPHRRMKPGARFAAGGMANFAPVSMPRNSPFSFKSSGTAPSTSGGMMQTVAGAVAPVMGTRMMANALDKVGISQPKAAIDGVFDAGKSAIKQALTPSTQAAAPVGTATTTAVPGGSSVAGSSAEDALVNKAAESATADAGATATADAGAAATADAGATTAGSVMGAVGTAMPYLAAGYMLGNALDLWADGGRVRKNMTDGGDVNGPGTGTSDSVPSWLSDGEGVINSRAMKMNKSETQKVIENWQKTGNGADDLVLAINDKGLEKRHGIEEAKANPRYEGGAQRLALGGIAQALGEGLYKAAPMMNTIDQQRIQDERQKQNDARTAALQGLQIDQAKRAADDDAKMRNMLQTGIEGTQKIMSGQGDDLIDQATASLNASPKNIFGGKIEFTQSLPDGGRAGRIVKNDGSTTEFSMTPQQLADQYMRHHMEETRYINPARFDAYLASQAASAEKADERNLKLTLNNNDNNTKIKTTQMTNDTSRSNNAATVALQGVQTKGAQLEQSGAVGAAKLAQDPNAVLSGDERAGIQYVTGKNQILRNTPEAQNKALIELKSTIKDNLTVGKGAMDSMSPEATKRAEAIMVRGEELGRDAVSKNRAINPAAIYKQATDDVDRATAIKGKSGASKPGSSAPKDLSTLWK